MLNMRIERGRGEGRGRERGEMIVSYIPSYLFLISCSQRLARRGCGGCSPHRQHCEEEEEGEREGGSVRKVGWYAVGGEWMKGERWRWREGYSWSALLLHAQRGQGGVFCLTCLLSSLLFVLLCCNVV